MPRQPDLSREGVLSALIRETRVLDREELIAVLGLRSTSALQKLDAALAELVADGHLHVNRRGGLTVTRRADLVEGVVIGHADGYGFLRPDSGDGDLFLPPLQMRQVLHGDKVLATLVERDRRGRAVGQVVQVVSRRSPVVVGRYLEDAGFGRVVPDDPRLSQDLLVPSGKAGAARPGDIVVAHIEGWPETHRSTTARIERVLGAAMGPGLAIDVAVASHGLPDPFPEAVLDEAARLGDAVREADLAGRLDLRALPFLTIDGEDARDFDDAVHAEPHGDGFRLRVAIADVGHYVRPGSALDAEARRRGTSVYFPDRVLPMLPEGLSNGLCSLKPDVDRLVLVADLAIGGDGLIRRARFAEAVIHSHARLTYRQAHAAISEGAAGLRKLGAVGVPLGHLDALYRLLAAARARRGAIDFEGQEVRFCFDADGEVAMVTPYARNDAHRLIEECMIAANVAAARFCQRHRLPTLNRVHAPPPVDRYEQARESLAEFGVALPAHEDLVPLDLARVLSGCRSRAEGPLIEALLLRAQSLAAYAPEAIGHFGLALPAYAHFTSPIRRYPDLVVHRAIRHGLRGGQAADHVHSRHEVAELGRACSALERRADEATREVAERLKCAWLERHLGEEFEALVTGVTGFGAFVELLESRISGLVHVTQLPNDYYHYDPLRHALVGERRRGGIRLADRIRVKVLAVDAASRKIDFGLVGELPERTSPAGRHLSARPRPERAGHRRGGRQRR